MLLDIIIYTFFVLALWVCFYIIFKQIGTIDKLDRVIQIMNNENDFLLKHNYKLARQLEAKKKFLNLQDSIIKDQEMELNGYRNSFNNN